MRITARGKLATIYLVDDQNKIFATCPVSDDGAVERCLDSGRYFVIRIQNAQGKHAYIGIAFNERNDAFDFNVALSEHKSECEREEQALATADAPVAPSRCYNILVSFLMYFNYFNICRDFSLKEGEKIKVKIGTSVDIFI